MVERRSPPKDVGGERSAILAGYRRVKNLLSFGGAAVLLILAGPLALSSCGPSGNPGAEAGNGTAALPATNTVVPLGTDGDRDGNGEGVSFVSPTKGPEGARAVLSSWSQALERGDFVTARGHYADGGQGSGMTAQAYEQNYRQYRTIAIEVGYGQMGGAAGTLYYTAPVVMWGKLQNGRSYRRAGNITLRRINDVPGSTMSERMWHIQYLDLQKSAV